MTAQAQRIAAMLASRPPDVRDWLARLAAALAAEPRLEDGVIDDLVARARPRWGVRSADDAAAYVAFWRDLVQHHDDPRLLAAYSDVLYLLGGPERAYEALRLFVDAVRRYPLVFIEYAGDFSEVAERCGPAAALDFDLAKIAFYARRVDDGGMEAAELQDEVHRVLTLYREVPDVRERLFEIARRAFRAT